VEFLIVKLDPDTRDELYADINPNLVDFVLLEAITLAGKEMINNPDAMIEAAGDEVYHLNDPDIDMEDSIRAILDVMVETDKLAGIDTTAEGYDIEEKYPFISDKLVLALSSVTFANKVGEVIMFHNVVSSPKFAQGVHVKGTHLGNVATLSLTPLAEAAQTVLALSKAVDLVKEQAISDLQSHIKKP
jgi:hypothetical protein